MTKSAAYVFVSLILYGALSVFLGGCTQQEPAKLTIAIEGRELSNARVYVDENYIGSLTQTVIQSDGEVYIDGKLAAKLHHQDGDRVSDTYTGCSDPIYMTSGKHAIALQKSETQPMNIIVNVTPGFHLLTIIPEKGLVKWDNTSLQVGPGTTAVVVSE